MSGSQGQVVCKRWAALRAPSVCLQVVEIILDGKEVTVQDVLRHQRWRPTTRSARHKLAKFVKDHEHLMRPDPSSPEGGCMLCCSWR